LYLFYKDPLFTISVLLYAMNRILTGCDLFICPFATNHLNDLLLVPCLLPPINHILMKTGARQIRTAPRLIEIFICLIIWTIAFEIIAPRLSSGATGDYWDVLCYFAGGIISWLFWNRQTMRIY
jgi:hypothetical protein